jgi:hypothetical protein
MFLIIYNFKIIYYKGTINFTNRPSKKPDYKEGLTNIT